MKRISLTAVLLVVASLSAESDELWDRGVSLFEPNSKWIAGSTIIETTELDRRGNIKNHETRQMVTEQRDAGLRTILIRAEKNGDDITEIEKSEEETREGSNDSSDDGAIPNPFDPSLQQSIEKKHRSTEQLEGGRFHLYDFRMSGDDDNEYVGTVWFDAETEIPVRIEATIEPLPRFAHFVNLSAEFNNDSIEWYITDIEIEGAGGLLFIYRKFESSIHFANHFRPQ